MAKAMAAGANSGNGRQSFGGSRGDARRNDFYQGRLQSIGAWARSALWKPGRRTATAQEAAGRGKTVPEGIEGQVPYKGPLGGLVD